MSNSQLVGTSFIDGLRAPHYINGRLLAAEDLKADQDAMLARLAWLGQASGHGVIEGLMVAPVDGSTTSVEVTAGLGLNRQGYLIRLPTKISLPLSPQAGTSQPADDAGLFKNCSFENVNAAGAVPGGAYLLTAAPASRLDGLAPVKGAAGSTTPPPCASKWEVEGLQFKAIRLTSFDLSPFGLTGNTAADLKQINRLRNMLAHWCYGSQELPKLARDPFHFGDGFGGLDQISADDLTPCDLPLAVFYWTGSDLKVVDAWSARRRLIHPGALVSWQGSLSDKRLAEGQARFLQFQDQLDGLAARNLSGVVATDYFRFLPPTCFVPIKPLLALVQQIVRDVGLPLIEKLYRQVLPSNFFGGDFEGIIKELLGKQEQMLTQQLMAVLPKAGFDAEPFFGGLHPNRVGLVDRETIDFTLQRSWYDEVIDLSGQPRFNLYIVGESVIGPMVALLTALLQKSVITPVISHIALSGALSPDTILKAWLAIVKKELGDRISMEWLSGASLLSNLSSLYVVIVKEPRPIQWIDQGGDQGHK